MSGIRVEGNTSGNIAEVTATNELKVTLPSVQTQAGFAVLTCQNDDGQHNGSVPIRRGPTVSVDNRLSVGLDTPLFDAAFTSVTQDTGVWRHAFTTMLAVQSGGFVTFNNSSLGTTTIGASLQSWRHFSLVNNGGLRLSLFGLITANTLPANQVVEFGFFNGSTPTVAPTEGVYFRLTNAGLVGVINFNGTETPTGVLDTPFIVQNEVIEYQIRMYADTVEFYGGGHYLATLDTPIANPQATMTCTQPVCVTMRNSGTVTGAQQFRLGHVSIEQRDVSVNIPYSHQLAAMGLMGSQATSGNTMGSTALYTNSLAPGAGAVMTNTTAALGSGLGGQFAALPTLAANTDGILCSYQVPAGTINIRPRTLMITGVKIQGCVTTVLAGNATPVIYALALAYGHTAVSAATAEGASFSANTTKAARRIPLGYESYAAAAALGTLGSTQGVYMNFNTPIAVNPGEFVQILAKNVGVVTTTGVITFLVTFDSYWM